MKGERIIGICLAVLLMVGCGSRGPQRPSQRKSEPPQADSASLALLELNQQLTVRADEQVAKAAKAQKAPFALYERGTWAYRQQAGQGETIREGERCSLGMKVYSLSGQLYIDTELSALAGKYELPAAIDANITEWKHGDRITLLAPWYAAFGIKGTEHVPPYENVRIELEIR